MKYTYTRRTETVMTERVTDDTGVYHRVKGRTALFFDDLESPQILAAEVVVPEHHPVYPYEQRVHERLQRAVDAACAERLMR